MDFSKYASFTAKDFLEDDDFINGVLNPTDESVRFWKQVAERYPNQREAIAQATSVIRGYRAQDTFTNESRQAELWKRIEAEVGPISAQPRVIQLPTRRIPALLRIAAAVLPLGLGSLFFWYNQEQHVETAFGEIKTVEMPDGTQVLLNGNSSLTYQRGWGKNSREVWLKGEGFFQVTHLNKDSTHIKPGEHFVVHCNDLNIEVLGTTFNVSNRHAKVDVGLVTGKIKLTTAVATKSAASVVLAPGDYVEYAAKTISAKKKLDHPEDLMTWSKHQFIFKDEKLDNILKVLEDTYGYHIEYSKTTSRELRIEGEINVTGVQELLQTISASLHVSIYQNGKQIIVN
ncbi:FecR family protein [Hymenobacter sp. GOD-10R]|uniref:FecR family protein n=1 Tax=Hymenobacter sp. GOD-10R TaxID=3093922 RepID=UPI002D76FCB3|nr:FecR domain-containing protein [Hymenobacter sp. GOD-10R]WRQ27338.1 FecR domain-containing protein [Hymenobacter sp. GOD-10R]